MTGFPDDQLRWAMLFQYLQEAMLRERDALLAEPAAKLRDLVARWRSSGALAALAAYVPRDALVWMQGVLPSHDHLNFDAGTWTVRVLPFSRTHDSSQRVTVSGALG